MPKSIKFVIGIHNHQPVGNFDHIFEFAYSYAYKPFMDVLERHPSIRITLHLTGSLLEWLEEHHSEFLDRLLRLGQRGQIEFMTGAFYEPILPVIPDHDKLGQIRLMSDYVRRRFRQRPRGMWLAERVWEPQLPRYLHEAGVRYTIVDDSHFKATGLDERECLGYYLSEDLGHPLAIFPISERLRYTIPFRDVEVTLEWLREIASDDGRNVAIFADDGEKFGIWPNTHTRCYTNGWLEKFFSTLEANSDWIELLTFSEVLERLPARGRIYLPTASYTEMMEWALLVRAGRRYEEFIAELKRMGIYESNKIFVRGSFWRAFQAKYEEANLMHKRMLYVSGKVQRARRRHPRSRRIARAQTSLWRAQCNCAYWHGVFGGLYLTHLRHAVYHNLIEADSIIEASRHKHPNWIESHEQDLDVDGHNEILVETPLQNLLFKPDQGGMLLAHDFKPALINLTDTLRRREETYHRKVAEVARQQAEASTGAASIHEAILSKETGLERFLHYDWYRRGSLIDHFLSAGTGLDDFYRARYGEDGDFVDQPYSASFKTRAGRGYVMLTRQGTIYQSDAPKPLRLTKTINITSLSSSLEIVYVLENLSDHEIRTRFGIEFNVNLLAGDAPDRFIYVEGQEIEDRRLASQGENIGVTRFGLVDKWLGLNVRWTFESPVTLWRCRVQTVSLSEAGFERV